MRRYLFTAGVAILVAGFIGAATGMPQLGQTELAVPRAVPPRIHPCQAPAPSGCAALPGTFRLTCPL